MIKILNFSGADRESFFALTKNDAPDVSATVSEIIKNVRERGDEALFEYCKRFDGATLSSLEVTPEEFDEAMALVPSELLDILKEAKENIWNFHSHQARSSFILNDTPGAIMGQRVVPLERVGIYVPGGTAAYPSSVLMNSIPAKIAGVSEIIMVTPPTGGKINPAILAAAKIAGVDRVFKIGGAQAVAALAYGTASVPRADKIVGPGNAFVAEAKRQVFGRVAIDMIAGPSEILIISDGDSNPRHLAADMLSQAEHDKNASAVLITTSASLAEAVSKEVEKQLCALPRQEIARASIENHGKIIIAASLDEAIDAANALAPEHLELCVSNPFDILGKIKNAGSIFMGRWCPEALGDYMAGPNHTLPTSGTARFSSPLSVDDFVKKMQYTYFTEDAFLNIADKVSLFAQSEGLDAHAMSALIRKKDEIK